MRRASVVAALVTAAALSAQVASVAMAAEFTFFNTTTEKHESGIFKAEDLVQMRLAVTAGGLEKFCNETAYEGQTATGTETTPTIKPTYGDCHVIIFGEERNAEIKTNGCEFQLHIDSKVNSDEYKGHGSLVNCSGSGIEIFVPSTGCIATAAPANNTNITGITYKNKTEKSPTDLEVDIETSNLHSSTNGGLLKCGTSSGTHATGTVNANLTVRAFNTSGQQIDMTIMD